MRWITAAALVGILMTAPAAAKESRNRRVTVEGEPFRIYMMTGEQVAVFHKKFASGFRGGQSEEIVRKMREAVRLTTGCDLQNDIWVENYRTGHLSCPPEGVKPWPNSPQTSQP